MNEMPEKIWAAKRNGCAVWWIGGPKSPDAEEYTLTSSIQAKLDAAEKMAEALERQCRVSEVVFDETAEALSQWRKVTEG